MARGLTGLILDRFLKAGMRLRAAKTLRFTQELAAEFYKVHHEKPFFPDLVAFMASGPVTAFVLRGERAVERLRSVMGRTDPAEALPGTVRHDFGFSRSYNTVHGPDTVADAEREIGMLFAENELLSLEDISNHLNWFA
jgi:nucleoside-diphosphate kinase